MFRILLLVLLSSTASAEITFIKTERQIVKEEAAKFISKNEGSVKKNNRHVLYDDANGKALITGDRIKAVPTLGYGRNVMERGLSEDEALYLLSNDVEECMQDLERTFPWYSNLSIEDKIVMVDLRFNLGMEGLKTFKKFLDSMSRGQGKEAAKHLLDSKYAKDVGPRATNNARILSN